MMWLFPLKKINKIIIKNKKGHLLLLVALKALQKAVKFGKWDKLNILL